MFSRRYTIEKELSFLPLLFYSGSYGQMTNEHPAETLGWMGL
jgi:hypothetical protein